MNARMDFIMKISELKALADGMCQVDDRIELYTRLEIRDIKSTQKKILQALIILHNKTAWLNEKYGH